MGPFGPTHLCKNCGNEVRPRVTSKLNGCFFVVLLCCFVIPGLLYLVWAGTQKVYSCPKCKAQNALVPLSAPEAQRLTSQADATARYNAAPVTRAERPCPWCAEPILTAAKVCKHCGRDVEVIAAAPEGTGAPEETLRPELAPTDEALLAHSQVAAPGRVEQAVLGAVAWVFGVLTAIAGIGVGRSDLLSGVLVLLIAAVLLPPVTRVLRQNLNVTLPVRAKAIVIVGLLIALGMAASAHDAAEKRDRNRVMEHNLRQRAESMLASVSATMLLQLPDSTLGFLARWTDSTVDARRRRAVVTAWQLRKARRIQEQQAQARARAEQRNHIEPLLHVRSLFAANVDSIEAALATELGTSAAIKFANLHAGSQWTATTQGAEVVVTVFHGRVIDVLVQFRTGARNWAVALALIDLQPVNQRPSISPPGGPRWDKAFPGIDEVQGVYEPLYGPGVSQLSVTPNRALYDQWTDAVDPAP
jgi:hypothetical protein